jgi:hypothetical protein
MGEPFEWLGVPHWYLWEGGFLLIGSGKGVVPPHAHHAIQIVVAMEGLVAIAGQDQEWREGPGLIVRPDAVHSFDCQGAWAAMFFVDPESSEGGWLQSSLSEDITLVAGAPLSAPARRMDWRVSKVLHQIQGADELRISLEDAAAIAPSPSPFNAAG